MTATASGAPATPCTLPGQAIATRAIQTVPAYKAFLEANGCPPDQPFEQLPPTDKDTYLRRYPFEELVGGDFDQTFTIFSSSGSSGHAFYWPQLKTGHATAAASLRGLLEGAFAIEQKRTLAIIGLALGSWIGGDHFSWAFKNVAAATPYPFAVFSPGNKHDEIIAIIHSATAMVDQFLLVCCPSAIGHLLLRAEQTGRPLPLEKLRYLVIGEPFPEFLRVDLERRSDRSLAEPVMLSVYGSADTGVLGFESPASIAVRRLCAEEPEFAAELGLPGAAPHLFHCADPDVCLETVAGELWVTKWQGIPLVRYNLHDHVHLLEWDQIADALPKARNTTVRTFLENLPPTLPSRLLAVTGRSDSCLILCGTNLTETMLDHAIRSADLQSDLTGIYRASVIIEDGRQRLEIIAESPHDPAATPGLIDSIYQRLIVALGRVQPEFHDDWTSIYHQWDTDPSRRILKLTLLPWPALSSTGEKTIKQRGIVK
jgi:phenylacetate-CoA ligase